MWVPPASPGVPASALSISVWERVKGSNNSSEELNASSERRWFRLRWAAKARAASIAPLIGAPRMLLLVSMTSMAPKLPRTALAGRTLAPSTGCPFSSTVERDDIGLHSLYLGDPRHSASTVLQAFEVNDKVESRADLLADRAHGKVEARHQDHRLDSGERVAR